MKFITYVDDFFIFIFELFGFSKEFLGQIEHYAASQGANIGDGNGYCWSLPIICSVVFLLHILYSG